MTTPEERYDETINAFLSLGLINEERAQRTRQFLNTIEKQLKEK